MRAAARQTLLIVAAVALLGVCGWVMWSHRVRAVYQAAEASQSDPAKLMMPRYELMRAHVKPAYGVVGFVSAGDDNESRGRYQLAAYALAPVVLTRGNEPGLVIVDFNGVEDVVAYANAHGMRAVAWATPGLALLQRVEPELP